MEALVKPFVIPVITVSHKELFYLAYTDQLTQCYNRNMLEVFRKELDQEVGQYLFVTIVDIDGLKSINDREGHVAGDNYICIVARQLAKRAGIIFRLGGDEFLLLNRNPINLEDINYISYGTVEKTAFDYLSDVMKTADMKMYEMKRKKKQRKEEFLNGFHASANDKIGWNPE